MTDFSDNSGINSRAVSALRARNTSDNESHPVVTIVIGHKGTPFPPPIYGSKHSPTSDCYNAREMHTNHRRAQTHL